MSENNFDHEARKLLRVFGKDTEYARKRMTANTELMQLIGEYMMQNPEQRFGQILRNLDIIREHRTCDPAAVPDWVNEFYSEPTEMLIRAKKAITRSLTKT